MSEENVFEGDLYFNGINGATGNYGLEPMSSEKLADIIKGDVGAEDTAGELLAGLTDEQKKLVDGLTDDQRQFLEELIGERKQKKLDQLIDDQQALFEGLSDEQKKRLANLTVEQRQLFEELLDGQKESLFAELPGEQQELFEELVDEQKERIAEKERLGELGFKKGMPPGFPCKEGVDPADLSQAGWAVIFPAKMKSKHRDAIKDALSELLTLRKKQARDLFRVYEKGDGYRPGETKFKYFSRHKVGDGAADPQEMPFYVLLVGNPEEIPYKFQYQLDVMRGVGRIDFGDDYDAYRQYARSVVLSESGQVKLKRQAAFFGVTNTSDRATQLSSKKLVQPLYENLQDRKGDELELEFTWKFANYSAKQATKEQLGHLLGGDQTPAFLFTASHGMEFPLGDKRQFSAQGALLCQDWPGPNKWRGKAIPEDFYFAGKDVQDANLLGLVALFFACYGAGTPKLDQFAKQAFKTRGIIAPQGFVGDLPKQMLKQGALAVIGHVERAWGYSFIMPGGDPDCQAFVTAMRKLLNGDPVGLATDPSFNIRYADKSSELSSILEDLEWDEEAISDYDLAQLWTANNDARGYVVIGDPAVRIPFARPGEKPDTKRPDPMSTKPKIKNSTRKSRSRK